MCNPRRPWRQLAVLFVSVWGSLVFGGSEVSSGTSYSFLTHSHLKGKHGLKI